MPDIDLAAIEARANAATEGPWEWHRDVYGDGSWDWMFLESAQDPEGLVLSAHGMHTEGWVDADEADAEFIAHARTDIPALVARVRELEAERSALLGTILEPGAGFEIQEINGRLMVRFTYPEGGHTEWLEQHVMMPDFNLRKGTR